MKTGTKARLTKHYQFGAEDTSIFKTPSTCIYTAAIATLIHGR